MNIKPENILLKDYENIKIIAYGIFENILLE